MPLHWLNTIVTSAFLITVIEALYCPAIPFYKTSYGNGRQLVTGLNVRPLKSGQTYSPLTYGNGNPKPRILNLKDPLLSDCAGFWFLDGVANSSAQTLYEMGTNGTGYWCSGGQAIRKHFDGISNTVTKHDGWSSTVALYCDGNTGKWETAPAAMLHGHYVAQIECNTMAMNYGPCA